MAGFQPCKLGAADSQNKTPAPLWRGGLFLVCQFGLRAIANRLIIDALSRG